MDLRLAVIRLRYVRGVALRRRQPVTACCGLLSMQYVTVPEKCQRIFWPYPLMEEPDAPRSALEKSCEMM